MGTILYVALCQWPTPPVAQCMVHRLSQTTKSPTVQCQRTTKSGPSVERLLVEINTGFEMRIQFANHQAKPISSVSSGHSPYWVGSKWKSCGVRKQRPEFSVH